MTVAAYQRGVLAADTCYTHMSGESPLYRSRGTKISVVRTPNFTLAIVTAGFDCHTDKYERAVFNAFLQIPDDENTPNQLRLDVEGVTDDYPTSIVMFRRGNTSGAFVGENLLRQVPVGGYASIGCDAPVALGALYVGAGPIRAVQAAAFHGTGSAGPIESLCSTFFEVTRETTCT